jgi:hypothetical protein
MKDFNLTPEQEAVLRSTVIDDLHPGALLHDFELLLDYVGEKGVKAGGKYNLLPIDAIPVLDERLAHPLRLDMKRPQLRSHPYLQGLHLLFRASGLARVEGTGEKARLAVDPVVMQSWSALNPTERYFALLEAWLLYSRPEMVGMDGRFDGPLLHNWGLSLSFLERMDELTRKRALPLFFRFGDGPFYIALADLFGLLALREPFTAVPRWELPDIKLTPFGQAMFVLIGKAWAELFDRREEEAGAEEAEEEEPQLRDELGVLQPIFQPCSRRGRRTW